MDEEGKRTVYQGRIVAIYDPVKYNVPPFGSKSGYYTAVLQPSKGRRKYLKFPDEKSLSKTGLHAEDKVRVEGCMHQADGKELLFDVKLQQRFA